MNYSTHIQNIKTHFPELSLHLLDESEFNLFSNEKFAAKYINLCIDLCNHVSQKLNITLDFAIIHNYAFNAKAKVKNQRAVIIFNLGLIEKIETIISDSIELFLFENIASLTVQKDEKEKLKNIQLTCCINYLFYHELAHVLQMFEANTNKMFEFQEQYSTENSFDIKNHIYEIDADLLGSLMSVFKLIEEIKDVNNQFNTLILFNSLTALLFSTANLIIEFSGNLFQEIYYKKNTHPHPLIRIGKCNEQILSFASKNLAIQKDFFLAILQRTVTMISQIRYSDDRAVNYSELYKKNFSKIETYIDEIEILNENFKELTRFKSQELFNNLNIQEYI